MRIVSNLSSSVSNKQYNCAVGKTSVRGINKVNNNNNNNNNNNSNNNNNNDSNNKYNNTNENLAEPDIMRQTGY